MKCAVSVSLGRSKRDKSMKVNLNGVEILVERVGTDGDAEKARRMYLELDGKVDAFGVGGVDLYLRLDNREYPLRAARLMLPLVSYFPLSMIFYGGAGGAGGYVGRQTCVRYPIV